MTITMNDEEAERLLKDLLKVRLTLLKPILLFVTEIYKYTHEVIGASPFSEQTTFVHWAISGCFGIPLFCLQELVLLFLST